MIEHFNTFIEYPGATISHWLICSFAGILLVIRSNGAKIFSITLLHCFIIYEIVEFMRIKDRGDVDIANGVFAFCVSVCIAFLVRQFLFHRGYLDG